MNLKELISYGPNVQVVLSLNDLREFAGLLINECRAERKEKNDIEPIYTPSEFAKKNGVCKTTLWRWTKAGLLRPTRIGGKVFYRQSDLRIVEG